MSLAILSTHSLYVPELDRCTEILIQFGASSEWPVGQPAGEKGNDGTKTAGHRSERNCAEKKNAACRERGAAR